MAEGRLEWIDWLRGFAIVLVVFYHAVIAFSVLGVAAPAWASVLNEVLTPYRMPVLMFLSGVLLTRSLRRPPREYISGKMRRIAWPYVVWTAIDIAFLIGASQVFGDGHQSAASIVPLLLDPRTYTWYLAHLFAYYMIALVTPSSMRLLGVPVLFAVAFIVGDGDGLSRFLFLLACFFAGDASSRYPAIWQTAVGSRLVVVLASVVLAVTGWLSLSGYGTRYGWATLAGILALLILGRALGERVSDIPVLRALTSVGKDSLIYYTVHWVVVTAAAHLLARAGVRIPELSLFLMLAVGFAIPWLVVRVRRRFPVLGLLFELPAHRGEIRRRWEPPVVRGTNESGAGSRGGSRS